jgi:hypothetical protein
MNANRYIGQSARQLNRTINIFSVAKPNFLLLYPFYLYSIFYLMRSIQLLLMKRPNKILVYKYFGELSLDVHNEGHLNFFKLYLEED